jgi:hypothetical protein
VLNLPSTLMAAPGEKERVSLPHPEIFQALSPGVQLLLDDGKVRLEVESCGPGKATTRVLVGGALNVSVASPCRQDSSRRACPHQPRKHPVARSGCTIKWKGYGEPVSK